MVDFVHNYGIICTAHMTTASGICYGAVLVHPMVWSVTSPYRIKMGKWMEVVFSTESTAGLCYNILQGNWVFPKIRELCLKALNLKKEYQFTSSVACYQLCSTEECHQFITLNVCLCVKQNRRDTTSHIGSVCSSCNLYSMVSIKISSQRSSPVAITLTTVQEEPK